MSYRLILGLGALTAIIKKLEIEMEFGVCGYNVIKAEVGAGGWEIRAGSWGLGSEGWVLVVKRQGLDFCGLQVVLYTMPYTLCQLDFPPISSLPEETP